MRPADLFLPAHPDGVGRRSPHPRAPVTTPRRARAVITDLPWAQRALTPKTGWPPSTGAGVLAAMPARAGGQARHDLGQW